jgi:asparagine synthase (glutamine-hydrolysing)
MKPMYYFQDGSQFLFASEIKAMRPWVSFQPDKFSIASYLLTFGGPTKGHTFYEGLTSLAPGTYLTTKGQGRPEISDFFLLTEFLDSETMTSLSEARPQQIVDRFDEALSESVARHMFADVPVGAFCSGGVDSSLLMAMAAKQYDDLAIFHANVKGQWSEQHAAASLSKHLGLELKSVDVEEQDFVDLLPRVMAHYEHPYTYHPNCAPLMMVAQLARDNGVKGLLSGEGSDECFLGYPWLGRKRLMDRYYGAGRGLRSAVRKLPGLGPLIWPYEGQTADIVKGLLNRREIDDDEALNALAFDQFDHKSKSSETLWTLDYLNHHLRTLLHRNDTMGMTASIEARFPFLDTNVVKLAVNLPAKYKLHYSPFVFEKAHPFMRDKWVVRKVADRYIPKNLSQRIKIGFWTTIFKRLDVSPRIFDGSFVTDLFKISSKQMDAVFEAGDQDLQMRLLHLDIWGRVCFQGEEPEAHVTRLRDMTSIRPE